MSVLRRNTLKHGRLGKNRRKIQRWRRADGRHSKIRENRFGYTKSPRIGFGSPASEAGLLRGKRAVLVHTISEIQKAPMQSIIIIARKVGAKKRIELLKQAHERKLSVFNARTGGNNGSA
jgi:ribosomal protein L32E